MPIYEYRCASCGHEVEVLQKLSDPALTDCPACKAAALTKLVSAAGFQLKGSGWYATDFRSNGKPAAPKAAESTSGDTKSETKGEGSATKGDGAGESKSEAKSAAAGGCGTSCACH